MRPGAAPNEAHETLISLLVLCHQSAAMANSNASSAALGLASSAGASLWNSVAAALLTMGDKHGPVTKTREVIYRTCPESLRERIEAGEIIPGWGNAFFKQSLDPSWVRMDHLIRSKYTGHHEEIERVGKAIFKSKGIVLYPNASAYTAVVAEIIGLDHGTEPMLAIASRLPAWGAQFLGAQK